MSSIQKKFDHLSQLIEEEIKKKRSVKPGGIARTVSSRTPYSLRNLGAIFEFLTDQSLVQYIRKRQMESALDALKKGSCIDDAISYTGLSDQPAFINTFKRHFGITPSEVKEGKCEISSEGPVSWMGIADMEADGQDLPADKYKPVRTYEEYGEGLIKDWPAQIKAEYDRMMEETYREQDELEMAILYGFTEDQARRTMDYAENNKMDMYDAFDDMYDRMCYGDPDGEEAVLFRDVMEYEGRFSGKQRMMEFSSGSYPEIYFTGRNTLGHFDHDYYDQNPDDLDGEYYRLMFNGIDDAEIEAMEKEDDYKTAELEDEYYEQCILEGEMGRIAMEKAEEEALQKMEEMCEQMRMEACASSFEEGEEGFILLCPEEEEDIIYELESDDIECDYYEQLSDNGQDESERRMRALEEWYENNEDQYWALIGGFR